MRLRRGAVWCLCASFGLAASPIGAQVYTRPELHWETIHTTHFDVHFPRVMRPWAIDAAGRLEGMHDAVVALVGSGPARKVSVVIDDPYNVSNGASLPFLDAPTIVLWPTPPEPTDDIGHIGDWAEVLTVHEFTHIAHLHQAWRETPSSGSCGVCRPGTSAQSRATRPGGSSRATPPTSRGGSPAAAGPTASHGPACCGSSRSRDAFRPTPS